jgi:hypothetical protein
MPGTRPGMTTSTYRSTFASAWRSQEKADHAARSTFHHGMISGTGIIPFRFERIAAG